LAIERRVFKISIVLPQHQVQSQHHNSWAPPPVLDAYEMKRSAVMLAFVLTSLLLLYAQDNKSVEVTAMFPRPTGKMHRITPGDLHFRMRS